MNLTVRNAVAERRSSYAAEAVRALHYAFAAHLDDAAEDLDRAAVVRAPDALTRRRKRKVGAGRANFLRQWMGDASMRCLENEVL